MRHKGMAEKRRKREYPIANAPIRHVGYWILSVGYWLFVFLFCCSAHMAPIPVID